MASCCWRSHGLAFPLNALALPALMLGEVGCLAYCTMSGTAVDMSCLRNDTLTGLATGYIPPAEAEETFYANLNSLDKDTY